MGADSRAKGQVPWDTARYTEASTRLPVPPIQMKIGVLFFGVLKDLAGRSGECIDLPEGAQVRELLSYYARREPRLEAMLPSLAISVNREYAETDRALREGDEVALLPPVSGGAPESDRVQEDVLDKGRNRRDEARNELPNEVPNELPNEVRLVREAIDTEAVVRRLQQPADGGVVIFQGVVRDNTRGRRTLYLDYEAYEAMALRQMESLALEARERFAVRGASLVHRLGRLEIGETSVLIVVAAAHRGAAFDACRWMIDTLKKTVPIWKKEYFGDGAVWADGEAFPEEIRHPKGTAGEAGAS
jgi:MoaE-MoaD fusion protein